MADDRKAVVEPKLREILSAIGISLLFVGATRWPFARTSPMETDERMFVLNLETTWFPTHHTLFQMAGRLVGLLVGDTYRGLVVLDMLVSALALVSVWWWLRALVRPSTATGSTLVVGVSPLFWSLGEMAGNYTMVPLVGSFLLGVAYRGWTQPRAWHPYAAAVVLAVGTGYREDLGTFWLPVLGVILWRHRWRPAIGALGLFTLINLAWLVPMLASVGGLAEYRRQSAAFAYSAGYKNSVWFLGWVDGPLRYLVKLALSMLVTLGPGLLALPRGLVRMEAMPHGRRLLALLGLSIGPALGSHLLVHFGVAGYGFHYLPSLVALMALGIGRSTSEDQGTVRLGALAALMAGFFLFYPANFDRPGWRGDLDLAVARYTRSGLHAELTNRAPGSWRTNNSVPSLRNEGKPSRVSPSTPTGGFLEPPGGSLAGQPAARYDQTP